MKLHIGDEVTVVAGKDKGKKGKIEKVFPRENSVVVSGVNMYKHNSKGGGGVKQAGIIDIVKPLSIAKVVLVCPKCSLETRVGYMVKNGVKNRICKKCKQILD